MFKSKTVLQHHKKKLMSEPVKSHFPNQFQSNQQTSIQTSDHLSSKQLQSRYPQINNFPKHPSSAEFQSHHPSFIHTHVPPPYISNIRQNSSSSSSSSHSQSSQSQQTASESALHRSSSSSSLLLDQEQDQDQIDENEMKLLTEAEIIDEHGSILRIRKMLTKDVFNLKECEKILVHVNEFYQPIKAAGGLLTRFMTLLLKEPNLCPREAKNWRECKTRCGIMLLVELRRRFTSNRKYGQSLIFYFYTEV